MAKYRARALPDSWYMLGNAELGLRLLDSFIIEEAKLRNMFRSQITYAFKNWVTEKILSIEADEVSNIPVEKALHKAARGDCQSAGRIIRDFIMGKAHSLIDERRSRRLEIELQSAQRNLERAISVQRLRASAGGLAAAEAKKEDRADRDSRICQEWDRLVASGVSPRNIPKMLEGRQGIGVTARQIKNIYAKRKVVTH